MISPSLWQRVSLRCRHIFVAFIALVALLAFAPRASAQTDERQTPALSDTLHQNGPHARVAFTDAPAENEAAAEPAALPHPETASDDFDNTTPTAWWIYTGQTSAEVSSTVTTNKARIIDLQVDSASPLTFTATYVKNTGAYAKAWWYYYGQTVDQVKALFTANKARPISLKAYMSGGNLLFAVVMIANTGADERAWAWYYGQEGSQLASLAATPGMRFIALDSYTNGSGDLRYTVILDGDKGANAVPGWYYQYNVPIGTISSDVSHGNRVIYFTGVGNGNFNAVLENCSKGCAEWWYWDGFENNPSGVVKTALQDGARPINLSRYPCGSNTCYASAMINNSNAITTRVGNLIRNGIDGKGGTEGLYLARVNGPGGPAVLANLDDNVIYEPASSIKVLANLYAMRKVQASAIKLTTPITHYANGADSCPNPPIVSGTEPLGTALREMMWHSDNARTREITDHFGDANIDAYAKSIGMLNSGIYHYIGCGGPIPDQLTLDDAATLYSGVANQEPLFLTAKNRGILYSNMAGRAQYESEGYDWTGVWDNDIPNIINHVAPAGTTSAQKQAYMNAMNVAYKAGNYVLCTTDACSGTVPVVEDIAITGWFQIPFCTASATTYAEYTWGIFFSNEPTESYNLSKPPTTQADMNFTTAKSELMREQIQAGMASCNGKSLEVMSYSPADLTFGSTTSPVTVGHTTPSKTVTITNHQPTAITGMSISAFGDFTETSTCGATLASGKSCTVSVDFTPTTTGERTGAVVITDNGTGQPQTIELTGTGG